MMTDRKKMLHKGNKLINFWRKNQIDQHHQKQMRIIISDFLLSNEMKDHESGMPFERCMLGFMSRFYGSFDLFKNGELDDLWEILKFETTE